MHDRNTAHPRGSPRWNFHLFYVWEPYFGAILFGSHIGAIFVWETYYIEHIEHVACTL